MDWFSSWFNRRAFSEDAGVLQCVPAERLERTMELDLQELKRLPAGSQLLIAGYLRTELNSCGYHAYSFLDIIKYAVLAFYQLRDYFTSETRIHQLSPTCTRITARRFGNSYGHARIDGHSEDCYIWTFRILVLNPRGLFAVGVVEADAVVNFPIFTSLNYGHGVRSDGDACISQWRRRKYYDTEPAFCQPYRAGDVVAVKLDLSAKTLSFRVNAHSWKQVCGNKHIWTDIQYKMAVCLGEPGDCIELIDYGKQEANCKHELIEYSKQEAQFQQREPLSIGIDPFISSESPTDDEEQVQLPTRIWYSKDGKEFIPDPFPPDHDFHHESISFSPDFHHEFFQRHDEQKQDNGANNNKEEELAVMRVQMESYQNNVDQKILEITNKVGTLSMKMDKMNQSIESIQRSIQLISEGEKKENENDNDNEQQMAVWMNKMLKLKQEMQSMKQAVSSLDQNRVHQLPNPLSGLDAVRAFFETELNLPQYVDVVFESGFESIESLLDVTSDDLKEMGVKIAHRKTILKAIEAKKPKQDIKFVFVV